MNEINLFGEEISEHEAGAKPLLRPKKTGYASAPGSGPEGETCKTCQNLCRIRCAKTYLKCGLIRASWTHGPGTDIKVNSPACAKWEPKKQKHETIYLAH